MAKTENFNLFKIESGEHENIILPKSNVIKDTIKDDPTLPMSSINYTDLKSDPKLQNINKNSFGLYYKVALFISTFWIILTSYSFYQFTNLKLDMLQIFGIIGIVFMPILIFFLIAYFIDRIASIKYEQKLLYPFLKNLLNSDSDTVKKVSNMIKENTESELQNISNRIQDIFKIYTSAIKIEADGAVSSLKRQLELMTTTTIKVSDNTNIINQQINLQTQNLVELLDSFSNKTKDVLAQEDLISKLYLKLNDTSKKTATDLQTVKILYDELNNKSDIIDKAGDKSIDAINKISSSIDNNLEKFINAITQINTSTNEYSKLANETSQNINNAIIGIDLLTDKTKEVSKSTENINSVIRKHSSDLSDVVNIVSTQTRLGEASLKHQANVLSETAQMLLSKMDDVGKKISMTIGNILALSDKISGSISGVHTNVINNANNMFDVIKKNFNETDGAFEKFKDMSVDISNKISGINSVVVSSVNELKQNFSSLNILIEKLKSFSALDLNNILKNRNIELDKVINNMEKKFESISMKLKESPVINSQSLQPHTSDEDKNINITKSLSESLNDISIITNNLSEISIDMTKIFASDIQSELWDKYYNGNRSVFMKYLLKEISTLNKDNLKKMYQNNTIFHASVDKFLKEFDVILINSMSVEKSKILTHIMMDSNVGKIYMLLKNILK